MYKWRPKTVKLKPLHYNGSIIESQWQNVANRIFFCPLKSPAFPILSVKGDVHKAMVIKDTLMARLHLCFVLTQNRCLSSKVLREEQRLCLLRSMWLSVLLKVPDLRGLWFNAVPMWSFPQCRIASDVGFFTAADDRNKFTSLLYHTYNICTLGLQWIM